MDSTARFGDRVEDYVKYRPSYPAAVFDTLERAYGVTKDVVVADVGSGTGISTRLFLSRGHEVYGVEPNAPMRGAAERDVPPETRAKFHSVDGTAEATGLGDASVGLVFAAQAFHWFDVPRARAECMRILRAPRLVALVWNERTVRGAFLEAYEALLLRCSPDYAKVRHQDAASPEAVRAFYAPDVATVHVFPNAQVLDRDGLFGRVLSSSYVPKSGPMHDAILRGLAQLWDAHGGSGTITWEYETRLYVGALSRSGSLP